MCIRDRCSGCSGGQGTAGSPPCVLAVIGQFVTGGMAQHVRMDLERDAGFASGARDDLAHRIGREWRFALANKYVGRSRVVSLYAAQGVQLGSAQRMDKRDGPEQPGRTLAPTDAATRKTDAPLQITRPCTALFVGTRPDQQCLPVSAQPPLGTAVPARPDSRIFTLE